jgi:hypothetical protein
MGQSFGWDRKSAAQCQGRCSTIKILPCSKALSAEQWSIDLKFAPVMVMSPYKWNIFDRDAKQHTFTFCFILYYVCLLLQCTSRCYETITTHPSLLYCNVPQYDVAILERSNIYQELSFVPHLSIPLINETAKNFMIYEENVGQQHWLYL